MVRCSFKDTVILPCVKETYKYLATVIDLKIKVQENDKQLNTKWWYFNTSM